MSALGPVAGSETPGRGEKLCPYCAEIIKAAAIKCRYCGSDLTEAATVTEIRTAADIHVAPETERRARTEGEPAPGDRAETEDRAAPDDRAAPEDRAETESDADAVAPSHHPGRLVTVGLVVLILVAGWALWAVTQRANDDDVAPSGELTSDGARAALMEQAVRLTSQVMSYRATSSAKDIAAAERLMTPAMRKDYEKSLPTPSERTKQAKLKIQVKGTVATLPAAQPASGTGQSDAACTATTCAVSLVSASADTAEVLVFVDQSATAHGSKNTVLSPTWQLVRLVRQDGVWIIDHMQAA